MIEALSEANINSIKNSSFRNYAKIYLTVERDFLKQIEQFGLPVSDESFMDVFDPSVDALAQRGLHVENDRKSLYLNWLSSSCLTCRRGLNTSTFLLSNACPRNCYFCFNPNQDNYDPFQKKPYDLIAELQALNKQGAVLTDIALTGGEPLLHKPEVESFYRHCNTLYPSAYTRLYTSGSFLDTACLDMLASVGLDEIRFSIKLEDSPAAQQETLKRIALSKEYIPQVVVEMPVMPNELEEMQQLLLTLDALHISGINLLELCFPFTNAQEFARRGFTIKPRPYRVLYNYWYAGGLPIAGSEEVCLKLLAFALDNKLKLGVHYCSLENKFSGQIFLQNNPYRSKYSRCVLSKKDYFLKSAKVFGNDVRILQRHFEQAGLTNYHFEKSDDYLEFPCSYISQLSEAFPGVEIGICYHVVEQRDNELALRELRIDKTTPAHFDAQADV